MGPPTSTLAEVGVSHGVRVSRRAAWRWPSVPRVDSRFCVSFSVPALSQALPSHAAYVHVGDLVSVAAFLGASGGPGGEGARSRLPLPLEG